MTKTIGNTAAVLFVCLLLVAAVLSVGKPETAFAEANSASMSDGIYSVPVDLSGLAMGADNFSSSAKLEKNGTNYYLTFGHSSSVSELTLQSDGKQTGFTKATDGGWTYYTYTMSAERIKEKLAFSAFITAMNRNVELTVGLKLSDARRTGDYTFEGERPAEYVPVITTSAGNTQMEKDSEFVLPQASATLGDEDCDVFVKVYFGSEQVNVEGNRILLSRVGDYTVVCRAESAAYKTNLGNNSWSEYTFTVTSGEGVTALAKFDDPNGYLPKGTIIQASTVGDGQQYSLAVRSMRNVSVRYSVMSIAYYSESGEEVCPSADITVYLAADATFDRNDIVVYHMSEDGTLTETDCSGYGRYVRVSTDKTGIFIICIPGVPFVMPMWGYALIVVGCVAVAAAVIAATVVFVKKKKRLAGCCPEQKGGIKKMSILQKFLANCKKPEGKFGAKIVKTMNRGHAPLSNWVFTVCPPTDGERILDVGCGGGGNILRMLERYPNCRVDGIDYSSVSVECSRQILKDHADRCEVICADVAKLPFEDGSYDRVVSFESIYFWQNPVAAMQEISRVLKVGGRLVIATEMSDPVKGKKWADRCDGMTVYTAEQLAAFFEKAGFSDVKVHKTRKVWCVVEGVKAEPGIASSTRTDR